MNSTVLNSLEDEVHTKLDKIFASEVFDELDMLSTHTRPEGVEEVKVEARNSAGGSVTFKGCGNVRCDLQYGSDGDCHRGDGLEQSDSFPFTFSGRAHKTHDGWNVVVDRDDIKVDTKGFWG